MHLKLEVSEQNIEDTIISAFEGGIGYWAQLVETSQGDEPYYKKAMSDGHHVKIRDICGEGEYFINLTSIRQGLTVMADKYPKHLHDIITERGDAYTGDALIQCAVFGEIIYG